MARLRSGGHRVAAVGRDSKALADLPSDAHIGSDTTTAEGAEVMAWLLSDAAARITGQVLAFDGGFTSVRPLVK